MFPTPEIEGGNNRVEGFHSYTFPNGYRYVFDQQTGGEKVNIIFSRDPRFDFEQLVYTLQGGKPQPVSYRRLAGQAGACAARINRRFRAWGDCMRRIRAIW